MQGKSTNTARDLIDKEQDLVFVKPSESCFEAAKLLEKHDVGSLPVVQDDSSKKLIGIVTDRDICLSVVAGGKDGRTVRVEECMSRDLVCAKPDSTFDDIAELMQDNQVRRIPIVDEKGAILGIVAQADLAQRLDEKTVGETVEEISKFGKGAKQAGKKREAA